MNTIPKQPATTEPEATPSVAAKAPAKSRAKKETPQKAKPAPKPAKVFTVKDVADAVSKYAEDLAKHLIEVSEATASEEIAKTAEKHFASTFVAESKSALSVLKLLGKPLPKSHKATLAEEIAGAEDELNALLEFLAEAKTSIPSPVKPGDKSRSPTLVKTVNTIHKVGGDPQDILERALETATCNGAPLHPDFKTKFAADIKTALEKVSQGATKSPPKALPLDPTTGKPLAPSPAKAEEETRKEADDESASEHDEQTPEPSPAEDSVGNSDSESEAVDPAVKPSACTHMTGIDLEDGTSLQALGSALFVLNDKKATIIGGITPPEVDLEEAGVDAFEDAALAAFEADYSDPKTVEELCARRSMPAFDASESEVDKTTLDALKAEGYSVVIKTIGTPVFKSACSNKRNPLFAASE